MTLNVVLSGIFYPMAILRYIERAFKRRTDINLVTIGPYTGSWIPWAGGMSLPEKYALPPTIEIPQRYDVFQVPIGYAEHRLKEIGFVPDLWVQVDAGFHFVGRPTQGRNVVVATDPHVFSNDHYPRVRPYVDTFFNMQTPYMREGDKWLPYAYDPEAHRPPTAEEAPDKEYDVILMGLLYDQRKHLIEALRAEGLNVYYNLGPIFDEARELYWKSRVAINWSSRDDLNARTFELLALGIPSVQNVVPDTRTIFPRFSPFLEFSDVQGAVRETKRLLDAEASEQSLLYETMSVTGTDAVVSHTWDARVQQILEESL